MGVPQVTVTLVTDTKVTVTMRKACLESIYELAKQDERIVFIGSDIGSGTLDRFKAEMPERFFMEGVSEAHLIGMMTGLALSGKIPYINTIATFVTRRCFEQILIDAALHSAKVRLIGSGGGSVYAPLGPTHLAIDDIAILRPIPGIAIIAPSDAEEMKQVMPKTIDYPGPLYIRMAKGGDRVVSDPKMPFEIGKAVLMCEGRDVLLISTGVTTQIALESVSMLKKEGLSASVLHMPTIKPLEAEAICNRAKGARCVISIEEHTVLGGLGSSVSEVLAEAGLAGSKRFCRIGFPDQFIHQYGSQAFLMKRYGISAENIVKKSKEFCR